MPLLLMSIDMAFGAVTTSQHEKQQLQLQEIANFSPLLNYFFVNITESEREYFFSTFESLLESQKQKLDQEIDYYNNIMKSNNRTGIPKEVVFYDESHNETVQSDLIQRNMERAKASSLAKVILFQKFLAHNCTGDVKIQTLKNASFKQVQQKRERRLWNKVKSTFESFFKDNDEEDSKQQPQPQLQSQSPSQTQQQYGPLITHIAIDDKTFFKGSNFTELNLILKLLENEGQSNVTKCITTALALEDEEEDIKLRASHILELEKRETGHKRERRIISVLRNAMEVGKSFTSSADEALGVVVRTGDEALETGAKPLDTGMQTYDDLLKRARVSNYAEDGFYPARQSTLDQLELKWQVHENLLKDDYDRLRLRDDKISTIRKQLDGQMKRAARRATDDSIGEDVDVFGEIWYSIETTKRLMDSTYIRFKYLNNIRKEGIMYYAARKNIQVLEDTHNMLVGIRTWIENIPVSNVNIPMQKPYVDTLASFKSVDDMTKTLPMKTLPPTINRGRQQADALFPPSNQVDNVVANHVDDVLGFDPLAKLLKSEAVESNQVDDVLGFDPLAKLLKSEAVESNQVDVDDVLGFDPLAKLLKSEAVESNQVDVDD
eukprot:Pgem_evm1s6533